MNVLSSLQFLRPGWRMAILAAVLFSVVLVSLTPPALAGFDEGLAAYDRGDYATALKEWRPLAEQGHAGAQNNLGAMYEDGRGVPEDKVLAYALYNLSAANDSSSENKAWSNRDWLAHKLSREALLRGQELSRQLAQPGNFSKALDAYLADTARQGDNPPARNAQKPGKGRAGTP